MLLEEHDVEDIDKLLLEQLEDREVSEELQLDDKDDGELLETLLLEETKENETLDEEEEGEENIWLLEQELIALLELVSLPNVTSYLDLMATSFFGHSNSFDQCQRDLRYIISVFLWFWNLMSSFEPVPNRR